MDFFDGVMYNKNNLISIALENMKKEEKVLLNAVLCFLVKDKQVLLARKAKKIGEGCWCGYGGGIDEGETELQANQRETKEESGVEIDSSSLEKVALVDFHNTKSDGTTFVCRVHVYLADKWRGVPKETEEMLMPTWFEIDNLPFDEMMPADIDWIPYIFKGKKIIAQAFLGPFQKERLAETKIEIVDDFLEK